MADDEYTDDLIAYPHLLGIRDAIAPELAARTLPELCDILVGAGAAMAFDTCSTDCGGMAWVRLAAAFASSNFPNPDLTPTRGVALMAESIELGIVRGVQLPEDPREGMDPDVLAEAGRLQLADMSAILAILCGYFRAREIPYIVGTYQPYGIEGGCVGGYWTVTVQTGVAPKPVS